MAHAFRTIMGNIIGHGVAWVIGEQHRKMRRTLAPSFNQENVARMAEQIIASAEKVRAKAPNLGTELDMFSQLEIRLGDHVSEANSSVCEANITPYISACTLDIIGHVAFGHDFKPQSDPPSFDADQIISSWHDIVADSTANTTFLAKLALRIFPGIAELPLPALRAQGGEPD
jgi:hypothetical protein